MGVTMDLTDNESYIRSCEGIANERLSRYPSLSDIEKSLEEINIYPNIGRIQPPQGIIVLDEISAESAEVCVLNGLFLAEHAAAGEATRLGLGPKYMINLRTDLTLARIAKMMSDEKGVAISPEQVVRDAGCTLEDFKPLSLGIRHMLQYTFDIIRLAEREMSDSADALARQYVLMILSESTSDKIISQFLEHRFYGLTPEHTLFMVQRSYHGLNKKDRFFYDKSSPKRLHNHGQMVMQQTMDKEIFYLDKKKEKHVLSSDEVHALLCRMQDKQSFNIEEPELLLDAIDYSGLAHALALGKRGYRMMMEVVANNPNQPQKGGMAAFDPKLGRNVMIESFQLKGMKNQDIKFLNRNCNHYMTPAESFIELRKKGLPMPFVVKDGFLYYQPVQGDMNFLVKTAFTQRKVLKPTNHWKSPATTPVMMKHCRLQDEQPKFLAHAKRYLGRI
jgi:hypothetical protein